MTEHACPQHQAPLTISGLVPEDDIARQNSTPLLQLDPRTYSRSQDCVHCGLCLPVCPTYTENGLEGDSPRGRITLIKALADGKIDPTQEVVRHLDLCLDCRACETACPSGVVYHELIEETRARLQVDRKRTFSDRLVEFAFYHVFAYPRRLKLALLPVRAMQAVGMWQYVRNTLAEVLPAKLAKMQQLLPADRLKSEPALKTFYPNTLEEGSPRKRVAFLAGCVGAVLFSDVNRQSIALLQHAGCDVYVPTAQDCCGAIHHHGGKPEVAVTMAKRNIKAMSHVADHEMDYIVANVAGCGAMLKEYDHLLRDDAASRKQAEAFAHKVRDISQVLAELLPEQMQHAVKQTVTYHDACHLAHGQKVTQPPRKLLGMIPDLKVVDLPESQMCCGAAGTYNLSEPVMARQLAERKIRHVEKTGAKICVTGNAGCAMQIQSEADRMGVDIEVVHPVTLLHEACFGHR